MELLSPDFEKMLSQLKQRTIDSFELSQVFGCPSEPMGSLASDLQRLSKVRCEDLLVKFNMLDAAIQNLERQSLRCMHTVEAQGLVEHAYDCRRLSERLASRLFPLVIVDRSEWSRHLAKLRLKCGIHAANLAKWREARSFALSSLELEANVSVRRRSVELLKVIDRQFHA